MRARLTNSAGQSRLDHKTFLEAKVGNTLKALWRTITKRNRDLGPLDRQADLRERLARMSRRRARRPRQMVRQ